MGDIKYIKGDLFKHIDGAGRGVCIPHIVNNVGAWGAGFVVPLAKHFSQTKIEYLKYYQDYTLGLVQYVSIKEKGAQSIVANMFAQKGIVSKSNPTPIDYNALGFCMQRIGYVCTGKKISIHAPKFGSGLAGGTWKIIEQMIYTIWVSLGIDVTIYSL